MEILYDQKLPNFKEFFHLSGIGNGTWRVRLFWSGLVVIVIARFFAIRLDFPVVRAWINSGTKKVLYKHWFFYRSFYNKARKVRNKYFEFREITDRIFSIGNMPTFNTLKNLIFWRTQKDPNENFATISYYIFRSSKRECQAIQ